MDQCRHCSVRGDIETCLQTPCVVRDNWLSETIMDENRALKENLENMKATAIQARDLSIKNLMKNMQSKDKPETISAIPAKLYRLPDGTWINPLTITSIIPGAGQFFPPRAIIRHSEGLVSIINCEHMHEARELCDRIGFAVNDEIEKWKKDE